MVEGTGRRKRLRLAVQWAANLLLAAAVASLGWCAVTLVRARVNQARANQYLEQVRSESRGAAGPPIHVAQGVMIGRIEIPRAGITSIVLEGTDPETLEQGVGHIEDTAIPGESGNVGLAGHRDTIFRGLKDIRANDEIRLTTLYGVYRYRVDSTKIVNPDAVDVLNDLGRPMLTLVTCYPFYFVGSAPQRFIVWAHQIV